MSILHDQPPLTQTSEPTSGEVTSVANISTHLGRESIGRVIDNPSPDNDADILYFPTHESLLAATAHICGVELVQVDEGISEINAAMARIDTEIAIQKDRLLAIEGYIDDLGLTNDSDITTKRFNGYNQADTVRLIRALENAREITRGVKDDLIEERRIILANLEEIEQKDFELLQKGR